MMVVGVITTATIDSDRPEQSREVVSCFSAIVTVEKIILSSSMAQSSTSSLVAPRSRRSSSVWDYEQSVMFGQYREDLADFALTEARKLQHLRAGDSSQKRLQRQSAMQREALKKVRRWLPLWRWLRAFCQFGGDLVFFATLAVTLAVLSFLMDNIVHQLMHFRHFLTHDLTDIFALNYAFWVLYMLVLVLISATITRYFSPQAAGSGVSEMKVILRGVTLKEYLSLKTLLTKIVGETFTLASGIYLGKEGPFVHISAMVANQFMKIFYHLTDPQQYESRFLEIMAVACGVGVAVSFASPVGGVLYSIEIVSVFFSVRSYWHGFTAATIGALLWRLLPVWFGQQEVVAPLFKTAFRADYPYETLELLSFALLGLLCGLAAYAYISLNRWFVLFNRRKNRVNAFLQQYPLLYPIIVTVGVGLVTFPSALGQYYTSCLTHEEAIRELYSNYTWFPLQNAVDDQEQRAVVDNWHTAHTTVFENTLLFSVMNIILIAVCTTLPIPGGIIVPSFKIGAGFGRFYGEGMAYLFPHGLMARFNRTEYPILAGTYALVGSAAFAGANTGAMSSAVIAFEMTGQITHLMPVIVATLVATITARYFGPAIYDSLIILKNLPYLPPILPSTSAGHQIFVENFCEKRLFYVWRKCTYRHLQEMLVAKQKLRFFPFVRSPKSMILLGTIERSELQFLLDSHLNELQIVPEQSQSKNELQNRSETMGLKFTVNTIHEEEEEDVSYSQEKKSAKEKTNKSEREKLLDVQVDFSSCPIDPAPFQLTEGTSLIKAHNLFSLLGLQMTFVTALGSLVGVISLKELGRAIDNLNQHDKEPEAPEMNGQKEPLDAFSDDDEEDDNEDGNKSGSDVEKGKVAVKKTVSIELPKK